MRAVAGYRPWRLAYLNQWVNGGQKTTKLPALLRNGQVGPLLPYP